MNFSLLFLIFNAFASQTIIVVLAGNDPTVIYTDGGCNREFNKKHRAARNYDTKYALSEDDVKFRCTNPQKKTAEVKFNDADVENKLNMGKPTKLVIHGFNARVSSDKWIQGLVHDWVKICECNVCAVDWSEMAEFMQGYEDVATNYTRLAANSVVRFLKGNKININEVEIAGHSLGAHVAGHVGRQFDGKIKAIYGMDPAGPGFNCMDDFTRLDSSDAHYVQCIYTDGNLNGLAVENKCGHANFLMNGGENQPGCILPTCDHARAHEYFQESLLPDHQFWGIPCIPKGVATENKTIDIIGIHSKKKEGTFCVPTNSDSESQFALPREKVVQRYWNPIKPSIWETLG